MDTRHTPRDFRYHRATSGDDASRRLSEPGAVAMGGGTDLLVQIQERLVRPDTVVDLRDIPAAAAIRPAPGGGIEIGAAARIADIAGDPLIRERYPALAAACDAVGTPALRAMGTLGGNLCQRPRCWYFRRGIPCLKSGGAGCPAKDGEHQYLGIFGGPCWAVHPSDPAVALTALDATALLRRAGPERRVPLAEFYVSPAERVDVETILEPGEWVAGVHLPDHAGGGAQVFHKLLQREAWDFALVSAAGVRRRDGEVRLVLGGVAHGPWRVSTSVEEDVAAGELDDDSIAAIVERALYDATPLARNGYKVDLAGALLRRTIAALQAPPR